MQGIWIRFWQDLRTSKHYLIAAALVFATGWAAGATGFGGMDRMAEQSAEGIGLIAEWMMSRDNPQLWMFLFIFLNNAVKAVLFVFMGAFLGLMPIYVLLLNGGMLGYVLQTASGPDMPGWELFVKGILPHGIVELPALIVACAYGIRFGFLLVRSLALALLPSRRSRAGAELLHFLTMLVPLTALLVLAMFAAAVIESTITPALLRLLL